MCVSLDVTFTSIKKIKSDFLGNEGPSERMANQRVAGPLKLFSQPSKMVNVNYVR